MSELLNRLVKEIKPLHAKVLADMRAEKAGARAERAEARVAVLEKTVANINRALLAVDDQRKQACDENKLLREENAEFRAWLDEARELLARLRVTPLRRGANVVTLLDKARAELPE